MTPALHIGINALYMIPGQVGGTEIYLRSLLAALASIDRENHYWVFTNRETGPDLIPVTSNFHHAPQPVNATFRPGRIAWEQTGLVWRASAQQLDALFNPGFTAPVIASCPQVTVFHDLQHKRQPENFRWFDLPFWRLLLWASVHRSAHLLADSEATRDDLLRYYRVAASKVTVAPLGVDPRFFEIGRARKPDTTRPFLLAVSTLHPHKNLDGLLRAFAEFRKERAEFRLVITGLRGFFARQLEELRDSLGLAGAVDFTGWIPREQLYGLFARAHAFFYPSRFEGFGLPVLEALAAGIPTACSNIQPVSGIAGGAALQFDPASGAAFADAMRRVTLDDELRARLVAAGPLRAGEFSWEKTAQITLDAIRACTKARAESRPGRA
ncbi:MAG: glycosyltransferase family 4 protein [Bryobacteraceae bacterium]